MNLLTIIKNQKSKYILVIGFGTSLGFCTLQLLIGLSYLSTSQEFIQDALEKHNLKMELVVRMHNMARERSLALYTMVSLEDPFERDDIYLKFLDYGGAFAKARGQLFKMTLTEQEKSIIEQQGKYANTAVPIQRQVVQLLHDDKFRAAQKLLREEAVPAQNKVLAALSSLRKLQLDSAELIIQSTNQSQNAAKRLIVILGIIALTIGILILFFVTRRIMDTEAKLFIEKELAEITLHSIGDAVITTDKADVITYINPVATTLTGYDNKQAVGRPLNEVLPLISSIDLHALEISAINSHNTAGMNHTTQQDVLSLEDGTQLSIEHTTAPILDNSQNVIGSIVVFRDVTKMRNLTSQLNYQATHDYLTGLLNRREFDNQLRETMNNARNQSKQHALLYIDLDQFKVINDTCGHLAGDELLKQLSLNFKNMIRESDRLARLGGDEFGIILINCIPEKAREIAESIRHMVQDIKFVWDDKGFDISASIGIVPITDQSGGISDIQSIADSACFEAKDLGRNRVHLYEPEDKRLVKRRGEMHWVHRINKALSSDNLILYYQDIVPLNNKVKTTHHCEILVRLKNELGEIIPPMAFIPAAERYNLMTLIDQQIIQKTLYFLKDNLFTSSLLSIAINISGQSLCENDFIDFIINKFDETKIDPSRIIFEITETAAITNLSHAIHFIKQLKKLGCRFALDDFGSGLSSFSYLKNIPVDYLKIDGSFVRDIDKDPTDFAFVQSINQIGHVMGLETIAEYVEDDTILKKLEEIGVDFAQGYHFCKPKPLTALKVAVKSSENDLILATNV